MKPITLGQVITETFIGGVCAGICFFAVFHAVIERVWP